MAAYSLSERRDLAIRAGDAIGQTASDLLAATEGPDHDATTGVGIVCELAGQLIHGATFLADAENYYASTALHRQLIEVFHLLAYFSLDKSSAARWRALTDRQLARQDNEFRPAQLRKKLRLDGTDYSNHCGLSGHPRPGGQILMRSGQLWSKRITVWSINANRQIPVTLPDLVYSDNLLHISEVVHAAALALDQIRLAEAQAETIAPVWYELRQHATDDPMWRITIRPPTQPA